MLKPERLGDLLSFAQDMQMHLTEQPFDRRVWLAEDSLGLLGRMAAERDETSSIYMIDSRLSYWQSGESIRTGRRVIMFGTLAAEGMFSDFSYFSLGKLNAHGRPVNSLCVDLTNVKLLPNGDRLPPEDIVHFPVLAVEQVIRVSYQGSDSESV